MKILLFAFLIHPVQDTVRIKLTNNVYATYGKHQTFEAPKKTWLKSFVEAFTDSFS